MSSAKKKQSLLRQLNSCKQRIAKERDKLRAIMAEYEAVADTAHTAVDLLEDAVDELSRYL